MKKGVILFSCLIFIFLLIVFVSFVRADLVGGGITTKTTKQLIMNVTVTAPPSLTIISPTNGTYLTHRNLFLNYSTSPDVESVWYTNNSGLNNYTLTSPRFFNASIGSNTIHMYANNTQGKASRDVTFFVDLTLFTILYSEFNGTTRGSSTNFLIYSYQELQNFSNVVLENSNYGKILFNQAINLTNDANPNDGILNLDANVNISHNRISLNSNAIPNFNKNATLWFYGLSFSNPRIMLNESECPSTICVQEYYAAGILKFNVTGFQGSVTYSVIEGSITPPPPSDGGGGGGDSGGIVANKSFTVTPGSFNVKLKQGESINETISIKNTGNVVLGFTMDNSQFLEFTRFNESSFSLSPGEEKEILLEFFAQENAIPDFYFGNISIRGDEVERRISVDLEIQPSRNLFDVKIDIPYRYLYVVPGENMTIKIDIENLLGMRQTILILVEYRIMDAKGRRIFEQNETMMILGNKSFDKDITIPRDAEIGEYLLYVRVMYEDKMGTSSEWFNVGERPILSLRNVLIAVGITLLILLVVLFKAARIKKGLKNLYKVNKYVIKSVLHRTKIIKR